MEELVKKMMELKAKKIDDGIYLVLKKKPKYLPTFIWHKMIKMLINVNYFVE